MRHHRVPSRLTAAFVLIVALSLAACGSTVTPTPVASAGASSASSAAPSTGAPSLTPVPGGASTLPEPVPTRIGTTQTDWGEILDDLPASFPLYPDADVAEGSGEVVSGSFEAPADVEPVVAWYTDAFTERGYAVDTGTALEDGSRVMDVAADLPECRIQITFRPSEESTIMTVLVASACATGTG